MAKSPFKYSFLAAFTLGTTFLVGCMGADTHAPGAEQYGSISVSVGTGDVNASSKSGLNKGATIELSKLIVTFVSNATPADTVRDTIVADEEQDFSSLSTEDQTIDSAYVLKALRTWYITVKTLDTKDSVIHSKSDTVVSLLAGQTVSKSIELAPRYIMYAAKFSFPDSIASSTGPDKQQLNVTRLIMIVNGDTVKDSSGTFAHGPLTTHSIGYDYVSVDSGTTVELTVIGNLSGWSFAGDSVLYRKSDITIAQRSTSGAETVTLPYVGPTTGTGAVTLVITKVGLYEVTATTEPIVVPKRSSK